MPDNKRVLIICWSFPPNPGIGGRRWAKFTKYLQLQGYDIYVLRQEADLKNNSGQWLSGLDENRLNVSEIKQHVLVKWLNSGAGLAGKIKNRIARFVLNLRYGGTIYDAAIGIENRTVMQIRSLIETHEISRVVVSGAPFNLLYYTALALEQFPDCVSVADYRDPWIKAQNYGMNNLSPERLANECQKQNKVLETFKFISSTSQFLLNQIKETYTGNSQLKARFTLLEHAYDSDDFSDLQAKTELLKPSEESDIHLVYGGAIYLETELYLKQLSGMLETTNAKGKVKIKATLYSADYKTYEGRYPYLDFMKPVGRGFFNLLQKADVLLLIYADHNKDYKTTKYYEYMPLGKPYLYLGPSGDISESLEKEQLGYAVKESDSDIHEILLKLRSAYKFMPERTAGHSFKSRTETLISMLETGGSGK